MPTTGLWLTLALIAAGQADGDGPSAAPSPPPRALDDRLVVERFAAEPDVVTPIGMAVEDDGGVLVVESHTHFRPEGYDGPPADRIRRFEDTDGDGRADRVTTFFEGTTHTMAVAIDPRDGSVLVATRREVFRLRDEDGDGRADEPRTTLARLETPGDYPHNGLSGFALGLDGHIVFGFGENLGEPYTLIGADGTTLEGGGEGGNVYRMAHDGSGLERIATGFWNPFGLAFDAFGRLFAVDNDPDSRPPCRLLHVVPEGDYGFRFRNGRRGLHPFTAWHGELPGTLGMVAATGEAPSGVVVYESDHLPDDYRGTLLVTSWGDHRIERYRLEPSGASFTATLEPIIVGGEDFRPVGIAVAPDGSLYVSDWVDKSYELHGQGRIWHIRAKSPEPRVERDRSGNQLEHADRTIREAMARRLSGPITMGAWLTALAGKAKSSPNPRTRALALEALAAFDARIERIAQSERDERDTPEPATETGQPPVVSPIEPSLSESVTKAVLDDDSADVRAVAVRLLPTDRVDLEAVAADDPSPLVRAEALRRLADPGAKVAILSALESDDPFLRQAARVGLANSLDLPALIDLSRGEVPAHRLAALLVLRDRPEPEARRAVGWLLDDPDPTIRAAAVQWVAEADLEEYRGDLDAALDRGVVGAPLFEAYLAALARLSGENPNDLDRGGGREIAARIAADPERPDALRRLALRLAPPDHPELTPEVLAALLDAPDAGLRIEAIRSLRDAPDPGRVAALLRIASDPDRPDDERAEAVVGLTGGSDDQRALLLDLATDGPPASRREALRSLRAVALTDDERDRLARAAGVDAELTALVAALGNADRMPDAPPADDLDAWLARLDGPADPAAGQRVFFHPQGPGCARCHSINGRGARLGPDLSTTGASMDRRRLVESILRPSMEVAPQFVPWLIAREDGTVATGVQVAESGDGTRSYADSEGRVFTVAAREVADRRPLDVSIMPDDLEHTMTAGEFRDLLRYLEQPAPRGSGTVASSATGRPPAPASSR